MTATQLPCFMSCLHATTFFILQYLKLFSVAFPRYAGWQLLPISTSSHYPHLVPNWLYWCQSDHSELQIWDSNSFPCKLSITTYRVKSNSLVLTAFMGCPTDFQSWAETNSSWCNPFNGHTMQPSGSLVYLELRCPRAFVPIVAMFALNALSQPHLVGKCNSFFKE